MVFMCFSQFSSWLCLTYLRKSTLYTMYFEKLSLNSFPEKVKSSFICLTSVHVSVAACSTCYWNSFFLKILLIFREGKGVRTRRRETSMCGFLLCASYWGPGLQLRHVCYPGNQTSDPLVPRPALNPLSCTSQGWNSLFSLSPLVDRGPLESKAQVLTCVF